MNNSVATRGTSQSVPITSYTQMNMIDRMRYSNTLADAKDLIKRGLFDNATGKPSAAKIFLVLETGAMLGLHPMAALQGIDVIEGNATISPQLMTGLIREAGHKLRIVKSGTIEGGDFSVTVTGIRSDDPDYPITDTWTPHRAARSGLCTYEKNAASGIWEVKARSKQGNPLPWEMWTENMCTWRATGNVGREGFNDVLMGISYTPEEFEVNITADGNVDDSIDADAESEILERIAKIDDKKDMADLFHELERNDGWTPRIRATFDSHISTITKDSRPPKEGFPGNTGDPEFDQRAITVKESAPTSTEPAESGENTAESLPAPVEEKKTPQNGAQRNAVQAAMTPEEWEAAEIARYEAEAEAAQEDRAMESGDGGNE